jgi:Ser-tRNA(Ala) deacylase AlaX
MPPHPALTDILLKFQVQLHQLTPNAIVLLSKYFWVVASFGGVPSADGFVKRYELHYQSNKMEVDGAVLEAQFGCLNFHAKWYKGSGAKLTIAVKNKWFVEWTRVWFYCNVPLL